MKKKTLAWAVLPAALLLAACGGGRSEESPSDSSTPEESTSQTESETSSTSESTVNHLDDFTHATGEAVERAYDERFDVMLEDFSGENLAGETEGGTLHKGRFEGVVDSDLYNFPSDTDRALYKAAGESYEGMNLGANGIGFRMRVTKGSVKLANLHLELRGGDAPLTTYKIELTDARDSDNEALPELSGEWQDFLINPGQTIEDENTVYKNVDGSDSEVAVLSKIVGFHLVANPEEVAGIVEIDEVFTYSGTSRVTLDDFNRTILNKVPNAWWGGSDSGAAHIIRKGLTLAGGATYTTPSLEGNKEDIVLTLLGDTSNVALTGLDASGNELATVNWGELAIGEGLVAAGVSADYQNLAIDLDQLTGNGTLDKVKVTATSAIELASVYLTSFEVPELDLSYPRLNPESFVVFDDFEREIASLNDDWGASAAIQANIDAGVNGFISYSNGENIKTHDGALILPATTADGYDQVTIGVTATHVLEGAKYVVIAAQGEDLNLLRFKFRGKGSNSDVYFNAALAAEGVKTYNDEVVDNPYVGEDGYTWYVLELGALNGLEAGDLIDIYYTGNSEAKIDKIFFANADHPVTVLGSEDKNVVGDASGYACLGEFANAGTQIGMTVASDDGATFESVRIIRNGQEFWMNQDKLVGYLPNGTLITKSTPVPETPTTVWFDLVASGLEDLTPAKTAMHMGVAGCTGHITLSKIYHGEIGYAHSYGGFPAASVNGATYVSLGKKQLIDAHDIIAITIKATGELTYETFRVECNKTFAFANNPDTWTCARADGSEVVASDPISTEGETIYLDVANSGIVLEAGKDLEIHFGGWGTGEGTIEILDIQGISLAGTPYNVIRG